jgi:hypothetical protein
LNQAKNVRIDPQRHLLLDRAIEFAGVAALTNR